MKFALASDLHLHFGPVQIKNTENADCLILAGDIVEIVELKRSTALSKRFTEFLSSVSDEFPEIIWVPGNHEYYKNYSVRHSEEKAREFLKKSGFSGVRFLQNQTVVIKNVPIHCSTLWTDLRKGDPWVKLNVQDRMNDYRYIRGGLPWKAGSKITPNDTMFLHHESLRFLEYALEDPRDSVIVTHHQPSFITLNPEHPKSDLDYAYASNLDDFILDRPNAKIWCAGHTHVSNQVIELPTGQKLATNCRGYFGHERIADEFAPIFLEV